MANHRKEGAGMGAAAGIGAALAAAAGAYWLYGAKDAPKHRKLAKSWMLKARAEVMDQIERVQNIDRKQYMAIVDSVVAGTAAAAAATRPEIARLTRDLRAGWLQMQEQMRGGKGAARRARRGTPKAKSSAKKPAKKRLRSRK